MENLGIMERIERKLDTLIALHENAAEVQTVPDKAVKQDEPAKAETPKPKSKPTPAPSKKGTAVDNAAPEVATRNRWIALTDGTIGAYVKGDELPPVEERAKNVTKGEYEKWFEAQMSEQGTEEVVGFEDGVFGGEDFDDEFADAEPEPENAELLPFDIFKTVVKLYGAGKNAARGRALMIKHSADSLPSIGQYEEDINGRNAVVKELQDWELYDKALARAKGE